MLPLDNRYTTHFQSAAPPSRRDPQVRLLGRDENIVNPCASAASVSVLKRLEDLERIRREWESWPGNRDSHIDSLLTFLRLHPRTERPHVLVVYRERRPDAILVGRIDRGHISCHLGYLRLNLPAKILYFVYGALRGNACRENCELLTASILRSLSDREADVAYINFLRQDSTLYKLVTYKPARFCRDYVQITQPHFAAALPTSAEEFYMTLSAGARWQAKSKQKKLLKDFAGDVRIRCFRDLAEVDAMIQDLEQVARKSYQRGLGVGFSDSPASRELLRLKAERGWLRGYVLYLKGRPAAFWIGDVNAGTFGSDYLAYDPEVGKYSPGMFLMYKVIEGFCEGNEERVSSVDFATGHAQYKQLLSNQEWREKSSYIFAPTLKGITLNLARSFIVGTDQMAKKFLASTSLLQKIKRGWRAKASAKQIAEV